MPSSAGIKEKSLTIIVPVFNECATVAAVLRRIVALPLPGYEKEVIAVDDGSTDGTGPLLEGLSRELPFVHLFHAVNRGKGAAIRTALQASHGALVLIQDADLEYDPTDIPQLVRAMEETDAAAVYGSRNLGLASRGRLAYYLGGRALTALMNVFFGSRLTDVNTGYKLFRGSTLRGIRIASDRFSFCEEVTAKLLKRGERIREVPIGYRPRTFEEGKKISWRDGVIGAWTIVKNRFSRKE